MGNWENWMRKYKYTRNDTQTNIFANRKKKKTQAKRKVLLILFT